MNITNWRPTGALRWKRTFDERNENACGMRPGYPECGPDRFTLQQEYIAFDSTGERKWLDVEIERE